MAPNRYHRQELFRPIGEQGQEKLAKSHVLIVGVGALGSSSAECLARAGVGKLTLIDRDYVEETNLQRQQLFCEKDVQNKLPKVIAAQSRLAEINSEVKVDAQAVDAGVDELESIIPDVDLVIDATDNFDTRLLINDMTQKHEKPWIYGGCVSSYGITFTVIPNETPCLQCLMDHIPKEGETCDTVGVISPAIQMVVAHQMTEAFKLLVGDKDQLSHKLIAFDLWKNERMELDVHKLKDSECPSCSDQRAYPNLAYHNQMKTAVLCGRNTVQIRPGEGRKSISLQQVAKSLEKNNRLNIFQNPYLVSFSVDDYRFVLFQDGRTLIHGTKDMTEAKKLYHQYIG
ncbi:MoeB/ThiF family adenylyltransferase [Gracilibacillus sp. YIM 98692]|uniref:MoeB/ThiF family adenylyltransferase n=1 Tax=Gracilibacillus sp. YIM 98692 TaxID=2663532 RepID=UPI0013D8E06E|nr:MoeB/ThiF family adenylyltransferase [Gracilibacillus sp. YIM 98692]